MEPSTTTGRKGSLANPEVREDVPGHVIPILQREFDDFDNEAEKYLGGDTPENEFIGFRLKQGVYGQRQPDVQIIRVKLPWAASRPGRWRPSRPRSSSSCRSRRATSRRGRTSRSTTSRCAMRPRTSASSPSPGSRAARAAATPCAT